MPRVRGLVGFDGARLRRLREKSGLTQIEAGKAVGVGEGTWGFWERSEKRPLLPHAVKICELLNCELDDLIAPDVKETLAGLRQRARVTVEEAAQALGLGVSTFYALERGSDVPLTEIRAETLARLYDVPLEAITSAERTRLD